MRVIFPCLNSNPKAKSHHWPRNEAPFALECHIDFHNLRGFCDFSQPQKKLYWELMVGSALDPLVEWLGWSLGDSLSMELGIKLELLEHFQVFAHLVSCLECIAPQQLGFQSVLGRHAQLSSL